MMLDDEEMEKSVLEHHMYYAYVSHIELERQELKTVMKVGRKWLHDMNFQLLFFFFCSWSPSLLMSF